MPPGRLFFLLPTKERTKENCRCFDAVRGCARGATVERSETGERTMIAPAGQSTARAGLRSKLAALVVRRQAGPRLGGCTPPRPPKRKSEVSAAKRTQYYCPFLTPPSLPPIVNSGVPPNPRRGGGKGPLVKGGCHRQVTGGFRRALPDCPLHPQTARNPSASLALGTSL